MTQYIKQDCCQSRVKLMKYVTFITSIIRPRLCNLHFSTDQILPKIEDQDVACYVHMDDSDSGIQNDLSSPEQSSVTDSVKTYASPVNSPEIVEKARPCTLPPCRVCEQRASGFHYGANTCEACKVGGNCGNSD